MALKNKAGQRLAGPKAQPVVGNLPELGKDPLAFFFRAQHDFGDTFSYMLGPQRVYFVIHPDDIKHILLENYQNYRKHNAYQKIKPLIGEGLLTSEGETWLHNRRLAQPVFHRQRIQAFGDMMVAKTDEMLGRWQAFVDAGEAIDVSQEMMRLTLSIVGQALFSVDVSARADTVSEALSFALEHSNRRIFSVLDLPLPSPNNLRYRRSIEQLDEVVFGIIEARRRAPQQEEDLLSMLLTAKDADTGASMSDRQLRDEAMTLFLAGHETTATALSWAFYLLAKHAAVRDRLLEELDSVLAGHVPTVANLPDLAYSRRVIDETLRLYPPAWIIGRHARKDDQLRETHVPAGTDISISPYLTHRHPAFWDDPESFDPERFLPERSEGRHRFAYFPFGGGPRLCVGNNFALLEMQVILLRILQRYSLQLVSGQAVELDPGITLRSKRGIRMRLEPR